MLEAAPVSTYFQRKTGILFLQCRAPLQQRISSYSAGRVAGELYRQRDNRASQSPAREAHHSGQRHRVGGSVAGTIALVAPARTVVGRSEEDQVTLGNAVQLPI